MSFKLKVKIIYLLFGLCTAGTLSATIVKNPSTKLHKKGVRPREKRSRIKQAKPSKKGKKLTLLIAIPIAGALYTYILPKKSTDLAGTDTYTPTNEHLAH